MVEIGSEKNTTIILPFPIELFRPLIELADRLDPLTAPRPIAETGTKSG
jgi:hypothetical protein